MLVRSEVHRGIEPGLPRGSLLFGPGRVQPPFRDLPPQCTPTDPDARVRRCRISAPETERDRDTSQGTHRKYRLLQRSFLPRVLSWLARALPVWLRTRTALRCKTFEMRPRAPVAWRQAFPDQVAARVRDGSGLRSGLLSCATPPPNQNSVLSPDAC